MGALGLSNSDGTGGGADDADSGLPDAPEPQGSDRARADDGTFVPAAKLKPELSRREKMAQEWDQRIEAKIKPLQDQWGQEKQTYEQRAAEDARQRQEYAQELARLRGQVEAFQRMPQQAQQPAGPDLGDLARKRKEALAANNYDEYERLTDAIYEAKARKLADESADTRLKTFRDEWQKNQPQQLRPDVQVLLGSHRNVLAAGLQTGLGWVGHYENELALGGMQPSPQRTAKAFELADARLKPAAPPRPQGFDQSSAAALSGAPQRGAASSAAGAGDGVTLTDSQKAAMKAGGFKTAEEYIKWSDPRKYGLVK